MTATARPRNLRTSFGLALQRAGTKTEFVLIDRSGAELARRRLAMPSYHLQVGFDGLVAVLREGVDGVLGQVGRSADDIGHAFFGLPAYGEDSRVTPRLDALPKAVLGHGRYTCGNDMICGWAGSLGGGDGISITAGTGSIGYGETGGRSARSGGWGELFGDEGSAYWVAIRGLALFSRMADGRAPPGPLLDVFRTAFALKSDLDLSGVVTADYGGERDRIAGLCPLVVAAAQQGDPAAATIFAEAAGELAVLALAIRNAVGYGPQDLVPVSTAGGLFDAGDLIMSPFRAALANLGRFSLIAPIYDSSMGAAIYAIRLARVAPT